MEPVPIAMEFVSPADALVPIASALVKEAVVFAPDPIAIDVIAAADADGPIATELVADAVELYPMEMAEVPEARAVLPIARLLVVPDAIGFAPQLAMPYPTAPLTGANVMFVEPIVIVTPFVHW